MSHDDEWESALAAELPYVDGARERAGWILGGLWFKVLRRRAGWPVRLVAALGFGMFAMWTYVAVAAVTDDAPDLPWPEGGWFAATNALMAVLFVFACWRPLLAAVLAIPATVALDVSAAMAASANGSPVLAVLLDTGMVAVFFGLTVAMAFIAERGLPSTRAGHG